VSLIPAFARHRSGHFVNAGTKGHQQIWNSRAALDLTFAMTVSRNTEAHLKSKTAGLLFEDDLLGKPVSDFPDHALVLGGE
jgi:hypothetical protein